MSTSTIFVAVLTLSTSPLLAQSPPAPMEPARGVFTPATSMKAARPEAPSLFRDLFRDIQRLPSLENAVVLGIAGATSFGIRNYDQPVTSHLAASAMFDRVFEPGNVIGGGYVQTGAAVATYAVGRLSANPKAAAVGADLVRAQMLNGVLTHSIKLSVRRVRPDGGRYSFPSGHTSSTFATASVLGRHLGWKVGMPAHTLATYVAAARIQKNEHFLTDVAFGAAIGIVSGRTATIGHGDARFAVSPAVTRGGAGVSFTLITRP